MILKRGTLKNGEHEVNRDWPVHAHRRVDRKGRSGASGFTLVEVMVLVLVLGVLSAMMIPEMGARLTRRQLRESAAGLLMAARHAHDHATMQREMCRVVLIQENNRLGYRLEVESDEEASGFKAITSGVIKETMLPKWIRFGAVLIDGVDVRGADVAGGLSQGDQVFCFYVNGSSDWAVIQLTDGNKTFSLVIDGSTGRAELVGEAVNELPNLREDLDA